MAKKQCRMVQWEKFHTVNWEPCCPECGEPAEMILGVFPNPCWAHKIKEKLICAVCKQEGVGDHFCTYLNENK